jgi:hypothetical protein
MPKGDAIVLALASFSLGILVCQMIFMWPAKRKGDDNA